MTNPEHIDDKLDLERTDQLFDASIVSSNAMKAAPYTDDAIKAARVTLGFGNLHLHTAATKISLHRLIGYRNQLAELKQNVERKIRNSKKYPNG